MKIGSALSLSCKVPASTDFEYFLHRCLWSLHRTIEHYQFDVSHAKIAYYWTNEHKSSLSRTRIVWLFSQLLSSSGRSTPHDANPTFSSTWWLRALKDCRGVIEGVCTSRSSDGGNESEGGTRGSCIQTPSPWCFSGEYSKIISLITQFCQFLHFFHREIITRSNHVL